MPETRFRVELAPDAEADLYKIVEYWSEHGESWRGEKYFRDLIDLAEAELSISQRARKGRRLESRKHPHAREILGFGVYRIIYEIDEAAGRVDVLRFWHTHRDTPSLE